jgi:hypothetical protein
MFMSFSYDVGPFFLNKPDWVLSADFCFFVYIRKVSEYDDNDSDVETKRSIYIYIYIIFFFLSWYAQPEPTDTIFLNCVYVRYIPQ